MQIKRALDIDILRGIAIITMVSANLAGEILQEPHPWFVRIYGSFAAPMFLTLVGFMVAFTVKKKSYGIKRFIRRGLYILMIAVLLDIFVWFNYPFVSFDVLYIIGLSIPFVYLVSKVSLITQVLTAFFIFILSQIFQVYFNYSGSILQLPITAPIKSFIQYIPTILKQFLISGWFPILPWIGFPILGASCLKVYDKFSSKSFLNQFFFFGLAVFCIGIIIWIISPGSLYTRFGYSELFYPPTLGYLLTSVGIIFIAQVITIKIQHLFIWPPVAVLGKLSLIMYVLHLIIIKHLICHFFVKCSLHTFLLIYIFLIIFLVVFGYGYLFLRKQKT